MTKKMWSLLLTGALIAGVFSAVPAQAATEIPGTVQIDDPLGDANGVNDQDNAYGTPAEGQGDHTEVGVGTSTDLLKVWFTNDASNVSLHFQTNGNPANLAYDSYFRFSSNPGTGSVAADETRGCLQWVASINGAAGAWTGETDGTLTDKCNVGTPVSTPLVTEEGPDGTFITTMTFPRDYSPVFADGGSISTPFGVSRVLYVGPTGTTGAFVTMDNTKRGADYSIVSGGAPTAPPVVSEPPGKNDPPGQGNQNCAKIKNKKKKKECKKNSGKTPPGDKCAAYEPSEFSKEEPITIVTDEVTADKPIEIELETPEGVGTTSASGPDGGDGATSHVFVNVQVDSKAPRTGLWSRIEFAPEWDYDLWVRNNDGVAAAGSAGGPPYAGPFDGTGQGGRAEMGAENVDGLATNDCQGYLIDIAGATTPGDTVTLKLWLGEIVYDPAAPAKAYVF
jgi:hypothetical protein